MPGTVPVLITLTGPDAPGITADLNAVLASLDVSLRDLEQVVVHGRLTMCLLVDLPDQAELRAPVMKELLYMASERSMRLDVEVREDAAAPAHEGARRIAITAIAEPITPRHLSLIASALTRYDANILAIERLSEGRLAAVEIRALLPDGPDVLGAVRHELLALALHEGVDLAVQREGLARRSMRLVAMDMDSTLIQVEVINELARAHGVYDEVQRLTRAAMAGELDYTQSLRARVALLEGLSHSEVLRIADSVPLTQGAERLVGVLKQLGFVTAVISGGFDIAADRVRDRLGLDYAHSNRLEVRDGVLTGRVLEPIVDPARKVALLEEIARKSGIALEQTVAIGDGANDLQMIERAGLGIAFHAKATLRAAADTTLSAGGLDRVLYLLGLRSSETRGLGVG